MEKQVYLDELGYDYASVGYGSLSVNRDADGDPLSLYADGEEKEYEHGFFAHAYSVLVFEGLQTRGFTRFTATVGIHKTARVNNTQASVVFKVLVDNREEYVSELFGAYTEEDGVEVNVEGADRIALIADSVGGNGNDHAVWADCKLTYYNAIKPDLQAYDAEFPSPYQVTSDNILSLARATAADGSDLTDRISYTTDYREGQTGEFSLTYRVSDGVATAEKTVKMTVLSEQRFVVGASEEYLTAPFADFVYYGRSQLSEQSRLAYDLLMEKLLKVDLSDSTVSSLTVDLQAEGIYVFPSEASKIKSYLIYDEARLYFLYYWRAGEGAGVTYTTENGFIRTITMPLNNGVNGYYYGQDNLSVCRRAETEVAKWFASLTYDMTDAQRLGIRSAYVVGTAGGAHAWNYLYADGGWYMTDTAWGSADSYGLLGKADMDRAGRYDYGNYGRMPALEQERYDLSLMRYPLMSVGDAVMIRVGEKFDPAALVSVPASVAEKVPVVSVHYKGKVDTAKKGNYTVEVTAENSFGNVAKGTCEVSVYEKTDKLSSLVPVQTGNSNYAFRTVSLYAGGAEREFSDGLYTKANGTLSPAFDISGMGYTHFSANVGVDKVIRDNVPWGSYANATVRVYADGELLYERKTSAGRRTIPPLPYGFPTARARLRWRSPILRGRAASAGATVCSIAERGRAFPKGSAFVSFFGVRVVKRVRLWYNREENYGRTECINLPIFHKTMAK